MKEGKKVCLQDEIFYIENKAIFKESKLGKTTELPENIPTEYILSNKWEEYIESSNNAKYKVGVYVRRYDNTTSRSIINIVSTSNEEYKYEIIDVGECYSEMGYKIHYHTGSSSFVEFEMYYPKLRKVDDSIWEKLILLYNKHKENIAVADNIINSYLYAN